MPNWRELSGVEIDNLRSNFIPRTYWLHLALLLAVLATPSIYLLLNFPPLWRDSDGFWQVTGEFNDLTVLHWPPLYCFLARLPIAFGQILAASARGQGIPQISFIHPVMTDLGVSLLLISQHALLIATLLFACVSATEFPIVQMLIAGWFVLNPTLYAFAHSVGSEALSNVFTLLTAILGYRCIDTQTANKAWQGAFFLSLVLAILTRHVNAILAGLLPVTLLLSLSLNIAGNLLRGNCIGSGKVILLQARFLKFALLGAGAILAANAVTILACRLTKTPYRSKIGATFEWRLDYLETISPNSQVQILKAIDHNLNDPAISYALGKTQALLAMRRPWDPTVIHRALFDILSAQGMTAWRALRFETDKRLNRIALQFLLTGGPQFWSVIIQDFWTSLNFSSADICREAFRTTDLLVQLSVGNSFRSIRHLATFQFQDQSYESRWSRNAFLTLGQSVRLWELMLIALFGAVWSCSLRQKRDPQFGIYLISLVITGAAMCFANCALTFMAPRFALPLYCLVVAGLAMLLGSLEIRFPGRRPA